MGDAIDRPPTSPASIPWAHAAPKLQYMPLRSRRRKRIVRAGLIALTLIVSVWAARHWGPPHLKQLKLLARQRHLMNYSPPGTQIIYALNDPATEAVVAGRADYQIVMSRGYTEITCLQSEEWADLTAVDWWRPSQPKTMMCPFAFLHERRTPSGRVILVNVVICITPRLGGCQLLAAGECMTPASSQPGSFGVPLMLGTTGLDVQTSSPVSRLRVYAGQPDPNDPTHFTIEYEWNEGSASPWKRGTIDGWARDSGDVKLQVRDGALTGRP